MSGVLFGSQNIEERYSGLWDMDNVQFESEIRISEESSIWGQIRGMRSMV